MTRARLRSLSAQYFAVLFALCVLGGGKRLTNITGVLVPVMGLIYIVVSLIVVIMNITNLPLVLKNIFVAAFDFKGDLRRLCRLPA